MQVVDSDEAQAENFFFHQEVADVASAVAVCAGVAGAVFLEREGVEFELFVEN